MKLFEWIAKIVEGTRNMISIKDEKQILEYIYELHYQESAQDIQNNRPQITETFQWLDQEINNKEVFLRQCNIKNSDNMQHEKFYYYLAFIGLESNTILTQLQRGITAHIQENQVVIQQENQQQPLQQNENENQQLIQAAQNELIQIQQNLYDCIESYIRSHYGIIGPIKKKYLNRVMQKKIFDSEDEDLTFGEFQTKLEKFPMELKGKIALDEYKILKNLGNQQVQPIDEEAKAQAGGEIIKEILKLESEIRNIHQVSIKDITDVESKFKRMAQFSNICKESENNKNNWIKLIQKIQIASFQQEKIKKNGFIEFMDKIL